MMLEASLFGRPRQAISERTGLNIGSDVLLASSPEGEDPGDERFSFRRPKVVGTDDQLSLAAATASLRGLHRQTMPVSLSRVADAVKLMESIFRPLNTVLVNELKAVYEAVGGGSGEVSMRLEESRSV